MAKRIDIQSLIGKKYGKLTVLEFAGRDKSYHIWLSVKCDCGKIVTMDLHRMRTGNTKSCGCGQLSGLRSNKTDVSKIIGQRFGRLVIIGDAGKNKRSVTQVLTRCDCGTEKILLLQTLRSGLVLSCGCYCRENSKQKATTHGLNRTPLHLMWKGMKSRCYNKNMENYKHYGGRGIVICDEWKNDFISFYNFAIKNNWKPGLEIDRKNNDLGYFPENCRFVTHRVNCNNRGPRRKPKEV